MGLTSANATPRREPPRSTAGHETPLSSMNTPPNVLDTLRKANVLNTTGIKEHERIMEDLKKENFDIKLRCFHLEEQLRKTTPGNLQAVLQENESLKATTEAQAVEIKAIKELLKEAQQDIDQQRRLNNATVEADAENRRLSQELELTRNQLQRSQAQIKSFEHQMELFDSESREMSKKMKQMEVDGNALQKRLAETNKVIQSKDDEIRELSQELQEKCALLQQNHQELRNAHSELELEMRKNQDLENRILMAENERDSLRAEMDPIRRRFTDGALRDPGSPRSSIDVLEATLLRQVGTATKQLEVLSKTNELTQGEKEKLMDQSRRMMSELSGGIRSLVSLYEKIVMATRMSNTQVATINSADMTLDRVIDELSKLCEMLVGEFSDCCHQRDSLSHDVKSLHEEVAMLRHSTDKSREVARMTQDKLAEVERDLDTTREQLVVSQSNVYRLEQTLKTAQDIELPKYREQCVTLQTAVKTMEAELAARERRQQDVRNEYESLRRRCSELEAEVAQSAATATMRQDDLHAMRHQQQELLHKLSSQEELNGQLSKKLDEARLQLAQMERVKTAVEESFQREIKSLHQTNADLRSQLAQVSTGKSTNDQRIERLQSSVNYLENAYEEVFSKLQAKEAAYSNLIRDHEVVAIEKATLERELAECRDALEKCETEITRLKRSEYTSRRGGEEMESLQNKISSLTSLNSYLREQVDNKDRALREASEKTRRQQEAIDKAYADLEQQHQKIKKRELIISRVLKRLENLNALSGLGNVMEDGDGGLSSTVVVAPDSPTKRQQF